jgi:outer membrane immunogenic protein
MQLTLKNTVLVLLTAAALALAWFYLSAAKAEAGSFTGCYGGGALGYSAALSDTSIDATGVGALANIDSLAASGGNVTALAGCDLQVGNTPFVVGVWGDHSWSQAEFSVNVLGAPGALIETGVDTSWAVGARVGYVVVPGALIYVKGGYTQAEIDDISFPALGPGAPVLSVPTLDGYVLGGGAEIQLGGGLALQTEASYADYDTADIKLGGPISLGLDVDELKARVGLIYRLWGDEASNVAKEIEALAPPASKPLK